MANTFYQYGKRDAIQYTDWSKISENFSTMISEELTRREDKKAEIQKATDEAMKFINDNPVGTYSLANDFSVAHANNAQEYLLMLDKKLKTGALNPKDFVMMRENLKTGTEGIYKVANAYQKRFEEVNADLLSGDPQLSNLTYARMIALEGLGRLENTDALIDVASGRVNLSKYDVVDGVKNYTEGYTTNEAMAFMQTDIKRFKVRDQVQKAADSLGTLTEAYVSESQVYGGLHILKEAVNMQDDSKLKGMKEGYQKWRNDTIDSFMNDINQASILVDFMEGQGYKAVTNKSEFDNDKTGKVLYIAPNGEVQFQDGQKEKARDVFALQLDQAIDRTYAEKAVGSKPYPRVGTGSGSGTGKGTKSVFAKYWMNVGSAKTLDDKQLALDAITQSDDAIKAGIVGAQFVQTEDGGLQIQVSNNDSRKNRIIDIPSGELTAEQWAGLGAQLFKDADYDKMMNEAEGWSYQEEALKGLGSETRGRTLEKMSNEEVFQTYAPLPKDVSVVNKIATYDGKDYDLRNKDDVRAIFNLMIANNKELFEGVDVDKRTRGTNIKVSVPIIDLKGNKTTKTKNFDMESFSDDIESEFARIVLETIGEEQARIRAEQMRARAEEQFLSVESSKKGKQKLPTVK
jgi:hypothetical protein